MNFEVILSSDDIADIKKFGEKFNKAGKTYSNFGSFGDGVTRENHKQFINTINGKLGELAFKFFLKREFKIDIEIDLDVWDGSTNCDGGQDIKEINGKVPNAIVDIKQSKSNSVWLAVEKHKIDGSVSKPDAFIFVTTAQECSFEYKTGHVFLPETITCIIEGFAFREDFYDKFNKPFFKFCRNEALYTWIFVENVLKNVYNSCSADILSNALHYTKKTWDCEKADIYMKVNLDARMNIALPKHILRRSKKEFDDFISLLKENKDQIQRNQIVGKK